METYIPQPKDKTKRDIGIEVLREILEGKTC
jgi:hypothetical protein